MRWERSISERLAGSFKAWLGQVLTCTGLTTATSNSEQNCEQWSSTSRERLRRGNTVSGWPRSSSRIEASYSVPPLPRFPRRSLLDHQQLCHQAMGGASSGDSVLEEVGCLYPPHFPRRVLLG